MASRTQSQLAPSSGIPGLDTAIVASGLPFDLDPAFPRTSIKEHLQHRHNASLNALAVRVYTAMFKAGNTPPPIGVTHDGLLVWGNHRDAGADGAGVDTLPAIVFDVDGIGADEHLTDVLLSLAVEENAPNGVPYTSLDRNDRAKSLINLGYSPQAIQRKLGLTAAQVSNLTREVNADKRLAALNIRLTPGTTRGVKQALSGPDARSLNDAPFRELVKLTDDAGFTSAEVNAHAKAAKATASDVDALDYLSEVRDSMREVIAIKATTGVTTRPGPVSKVKDACKRVLSLCDATIVPAVYRDHTNDVVDTAKMLDDAIACLQGIRAVQVLPTDDDDVEDVEAFRNDPAFRDGSASPFGEAEG